MHNSLWKKVVVLGLVVLIIGTSVVSSIRVTIRETSMVSSGKENFEIEKDYEKNLYLFRCL